jgi:hypothetical protein
MKIFPVIVALLVSASAVAQERGSIPPGQSQDGARPSDGAITGGSILPGEKSGVPDGAPEVKPSPAEREKRCMQLSGVLREECLLNEKGASSGGTVAPDAQTGAPPRTAPPPQEPLR